MSKWENILKSFNNNPEKVAKWFDKDISEMIMFFFDKGFTDQVSEKNLIEYIDLILYYRLTNSENKLETIKKISEEYLSDVTFDNGKFFLETDVDNIISLFKTYSRSRDFAEAILDDDDWEPFESYPGIDYFYDDCISNLDDDVKLLTADFLNNELMGSKIEPETEFLESIAEIQGHSDYVDLSTNIILEIFEDKKSTISIIGGTDFYFTLASSYNQAYNQAYTSELYEKVYNEISYFFNSEELGNKEYKHQLRNGRKYDFVVFKIDVTNSIHRFLDTYLSDWERNWNDIQYHGDLMGLIMEMLDDSLDKIDAHPPDSPDYRNVNKLYNEIVKDSL